MRGELSDTCQEEGGHKNRPSNYDRQMEYERAREKKSYVGFSQGEEGKGERACQGERPSTMGGEFTPPEGGEKALAEKGRPILSVRGGNSLEGERLLFLPFGGGLCELKTFYHYQRGEGKAPP